MTLPDDIVRAALLGTDQRRSAGDRRASTGESEESAVLLTAARLGLRARAGFVPPCDERPLPPASGSDAAAVCGFQAMRYLRLLLVGQHAQALTEWFTVAALAGRRVQPDYLPRLLTLGAARKDLRPFLQPVLGERGRWLAQQITNQNWGWALDTTGPSLAEAIAAKQADEPRLWEAMQWPALPKGWEIAREHGMLWSHELTMGLMQQLRSSAPAMARINWRTERLQELIWGLAYFFPLDMRRTLLGFFGSRQVFKEFDCVRLRESVRTVLDFRQGMVDAIQSEE